MTLNKNELLQIKGGAINWTAISVIGTVVSFIAGILDGYFRPIKCEK